MLSRAANDLSVSKSLSSTKKFVVEIVGAAVVREEFGAPAIGEGVGAAVVGDKVGATLNRDWPRYKPYSTIHAYFTTYYANKAVPTIGKLSAQIHIQPQAATTKQQVIISSGFTIVRQSVSLFTSVELFIFESERDSLFKSGAILWESITDTHSTPSSNHQATSHHQQWIHSSPAVHFLISVLSYSIQQQRSSTINIVLGHHSLTV
jgi:hypothetical protein